MTREDLELSGVGDLTLTVGCVAGWAPFPENSAKRSSSFRRDHFGSEIALIMYACQCMYQIRLEEAIFRLKAPLTIYNRNTI